MSAAQSASSFVATVYGVGIVSALLSPGLVRRQGGVRATQAVLLAAAGMLALAALGHGVAGLALAAVVLGLGYGAAAPASTHLLVPQTPRPVFNLVMSLRQIGVPLGGVLAALILPPLALAIGWRNALLAELGPVLLLIGLMEIPRRAGIMIASPAAACWDAPCCSRSRCWRSHGSGGCRWRHLPILASHCAWWRS